MAILESRRSVRMPMRQKRSGVFGLPFLAFQILTLACTSIVAVSNSAATHADPVSLEETTGNHTTDDGYNVSLTLLDLSVNSVANMGSTLFTREAFLSGKAAVSIDGKGNFPVDSGLLKIGLQASCQIDLSNGLEAQGGANANWTSPNANIGIGAGGLNVNTGNVNVGVNGFLDVYLRPGQIVTVPISVKQLNGRTGGTRVTDEHLNVDACGGAAYVRLFAVVQLSTTENDDTFSVYGPIVSF
ncbi:MAG: MspA family porin [Segniliparus sp.]|uniref:MspA family porin n=1 Tax=Segniliparus sp. TaxID=2804064 RepID=UPI003F40F2A1